MPIMASTNFLDKKQINDYFVQKNWCFEDKLQNIDINKKNYPIPKIIIKEVTKSTNDDAKNIMSNEATVIFAKKQTSGRGRQGHSFYSPEGSGLYFSAILDYEKITNNTTQTIINPAKITVSAAVAICNAVKKCCNIFLDVKWVNDLFFNKKKVCGILTEGSIGINSKKIDKIILGVGINVYSFKDELPEDIKNIAGSLSCDNIDINELSSEIVYQLYKNCYSINFLWDDILKTYKNHCNLLGKEVCVIDKFNHNDYYARVLDIDDEAALVIELDDGSVKKLNSGEISVKM